MDTEVTGSQAETEPAGGATVALEGALLKVLQGLFYGLLVLPALVALVQELVGWVPASWLSTFWLYQLTRLDSGLQLGSGTYLTRGWLLAIWALVLLLGIQRPRAGRTLWKMGLTFSGVAVLSAYRSSHPFESFLSAIDCSLILVVIWLAAVMRPHNRIPQLICLSSVIVAIISLQRYLSGGPSDDLRLAGTFHQPNMTATYLACCIPWLLHQEAGAYRPISRRVLAVIGLSLVLAALALTVTRAAWLVVVLGLAFRWWLGARAKTGPIGLPSLLAAGAVALTIGSCAVLATRNQSFLVAGLALIVVALWRSDLRGIGALSLAVAAGTSSWIYSLSIQGTQVATMTAGRAQELIGEQSFSLFARMEFWRAAFLMGWEHPLLGVGPHGFHRYYPSYQIDLRWFSKYTHSSLLTVWAELGLTGTLLISAAGLLALRAIYLGLQQPDAKSRLQIADTAMGMATITLCSLTDVQWQFPMLPITWAALLGSALGQSWPVEQPEQEQQAQPVSRWTIRPQVVLGYLVVSLAGIGSALNVMWAYAEYYADLAQVSLTRGQFKEAATLDRQALTLNPLQASYYHHLGLSLMALHQANPKAEVDLKEVQHTARRAIALDSHRAVHYDLMAKYYLTKENWAEVQAFSSRAIQCDPANYPSFYTVLAISLDSQKQSDQAARILQSCIERFPPEAFGTMMSFRRNEVERQLVSAYLQLAQLIDLDKNPTRALSYFDGALSLEPKDENARVGRILCLLRLGRVQEARAEAVEAQKNGGHPTFGDLVKQIDAAQAPPSSSK